MPTTDTWSAAVDRWRADNVHATDPSPPARGEASIDAHLEELERLEALSFNELRSYAVSLGLSGAGNREAITARILEAL
jgi:hypothetical protein